MKVPMVIVHFALAAILGLQAWELKMLVSLDERVARMEVMNRADKSDPTAPNVAMTTGR